MPDHASWFTYLLAMPNFRGLWALVNHLGCVSPEGQTQTPEAGAVCPAGFELRELPNHFTYPVNTPVTLEYTVLGVFVVLLIATMVMIARARVTRTQAAVVPEGSLTVAAFMENFAEAFYGMLREVLGKDEAKHGAETGEARGKFEV